MKREEFDHIRADVHTAILEAQQHDPTAPLEILWRLFDAVGQVAMDGPGHACGVAFEVCPRCYPDAWAERLLADVQLRAVSKVPYGEPQDDTPPEDHRD